MEPYSPKRILTDEQEAEIGGDFLAYLIKNAIQVHAHGTGMMHVAAAFNKDTISYREILYLNLEFIQKQLLII